MVSRRARVQRQRNSVFLGLAMKVAQDEQALVKKAGGKETNAG